MINRKIAERRWLKEPTQLQWRVILPSAKTTQLSVINNNLIRQRRCNRGTKEMRHLRPIVVFYTADLSSFIKRLCNSTHLREKSQM